VPTSTLRGILLAVAVVVGALMIAKGFSSSTSSALTAPPSSPSPSPTVSMPPVSPSPSGAAGLTHKEAVQGVAVQVLNGTNVNGLAGVVADKLKGKGYKIYAVSNAGKSTYATTVIYYEKGQKNRAEYMEQHYLQGAQVKAAGNLFTAPVQLTVIAGSDQAPPSST